MPSHADFSRPHRASEPNARNSGIARLSQQGRRTESSAALARRWVRQADAPDIRHRHGVPWHAAPSPRRWHACRPQTIELYRDGLVFSGTLHCACGAVTDSTGRWRYRNSRRFTDPAGLCRDPRTPQPVRGRVAAAPSPSRFPPPPASPPGKQ